MSRILSLTAAFLLIAGGANAGTLTSATWAGDFQGNPFSLTTGGGGLTATGTSVGTTANVSVTVAPQLFSTLQTGGAAPVFISQSLGGSQTIGINGGVSVNQGVSGGVNVYVGNDNTGLLLFTVPLTVGVTPAGGNPFFQITALVPGFNIPVTVTASAFGWQTGPYSFASSTLDGVAVPTPFTAAGGNTLTANGGGTITLIAPSVTAVCAGSPFSPFPCNGASQQSTSAGVTTLTLNFIPSIVPEPGTLLLLGAGLLGLAGVGSRRRA